MKKFYTTAIALMIAATGALNAQKLITLDGALNAERGSCTFGEVTTELEWAICPFEFALYDVDGFDFPEGGGIGILFVEIDGSGGQDGLALIDIQMALPLALNAGLGGLLAANDLDPFSGLWAVAGFVYTDAENINETICAEVGLEDTVIIEFLSAQDKLCDFEGDCPPGEIEDCNGNCAPEEWLGDGFCDDGSFSHNGVAIFFNCDEFNNDEGDCDDTSVTDFDALKGITNVFPNPANAQLTISYDAATPDMVDLMILNANGQIVYRVNEYIAGPMNRVIDVSNWATGMYLVRTSTEAGQTVQKLIINR